MKERKIEINITVKTASQKTTTEVIEGVQNLLDDWDFIDQENQSGKLYSDICITMLKNE